MFRLYWIVRKVRAVKDLNLINEIKNLNLLRFNFPSKSARTFRTTQYLVFISRRNIVHNCPIYLITLTYYMRIILRSNYK